MGRVRDLQDHRRTSAPTVLHPLSPARRGAPADASTITRQPAFTTFVNPKRPHGAATTETAPRPSCPRDDHRLRHAVNVHLVGVSGLPDDLDGSQLRDARAQPVGHRRPIAADRNRQAISLVSIVPGAPADLLVVRGRSLLEAMASASEHRIVIKAGRVVARTTVDSVTHPVTDPGAHDREQSEYHRSCSDRCCRRRHVLPSGQARHRRARRCLPGSVAGQADDRLHHHGGGARTDRVHRRRHARDSSNPLVAHLDSSLSAR